MFKSYTFILYICLIHFDIFYRKNLIIPDDKWQVKANLDHNHPDFFLIVGYLAAPDRMTKLDIETPLSTQTDTEARYSQLSGKLLTRGTNYYVWPEGTNKWGPELRISFNSNSNIPSALSSEVHRPRYNPGIYDSRVNDNVFVWDLIQYGFEASDSQAPNRIQSRIPLSKVPDYTRGYTL